MAFLYKIFVLNIGSTSTKLACFENLKLIAKDNMVFEKKKISLQDRLVEQIPGRKKQIYDFIRQNGIDLKKIDILVSRGGIGAPVPGGVYEINDAMCRDLREERYGRHDSGLGPLIASEIALKYRMRAIVIDPPSTDEFHLLARFSGNPEIKRESAFHALNQKAAARRVAASMGSSYQKLNLIVAHLGGGITIGAHVKGMVIDSTHGLSEGPFTPQRAGSLPTLPLLGLTGEKDISSTRDLLVGSSGLRAYLDTADARAVEAMINQGNEQAKRVYEAMAYQIAKDIGAMATVMKGAVDGIVITGGLAHSTMLVKWIKERAEFIGKISVLPGEDELLALAEGGMRILTGKEPVKDYPQ